MSPAVKSNAVNYMDSLQSKMKEMMQMGEAIEAVDNARAAHRKVSRGRRTKEESAAISIETDEAWARCQSGEPRQDVADSFGITYNALTRRFFGKGYRTVNKGRKL